ncbi:autotransporter outer membrane beta-barrel domain-containing protein [Phascolarctobacterium faecium]|uniref:autotransporter outer membrane beta-barrel domain-containing protein n=1 Tax=Phascolarctobacterium faecium TaxID=33025 RepID=UPI000F0C03CF|nr:autotransporter outer membrane beta-barrel domain-containing protein [Phascolarctobacterium faecium]BBG64538.1 AIDA-I autotransporter precursor [Phascolarctobacterium faecium]
MRSIKVNRKKSKQILAALVMGMNFVNTIAPMAVAMQKLTTEGKSQLQMVKSKAKPLEYVSLPQSLEFVDDLIFGKAEAAVISVGAGQTSTLPTLASGDFMNISSGGTGTVSTMNGGSQVISGGGTGTVSSLNGGEQHISSGGTGTISAMSAGIQYISVGGAGTVSTLNAGNIHILSGAIGTVSTMNAGNLHIYDGGTGTVSTMSGGLQNVSSGGAVTLGVMNGGYQTIVGGTGTISTMSGGTQTVSSGGTGIIGTFINGRQNVTEGTGTISTMSGGTQNIYSGATGTVSTMSGGTQNIYSGATGTVSTLRYGGIQNVRNGGTGTISTMSAGLQYIHSGGTGTVSTMMNGGYMNISGGGTGVVSTMSGGEQNIYSGGTGIVSTMSGGLQSLASGGTGTISSLNGSGYQSIHGGTGTISTMSGGSQGIDSGATGVVSTMSAGLQYIRSGGTGVVSAMSGGIQYIRSGGTSRDTMIYGGIQLIANGGTANNTIVNGGTAAILGAGAAVEDVTMTGGEYLLGTDGGTYYLNGIFGFSGGNFDMTKNISGSTPGSYETLNINNLQHGGGTFVMNTDLASETNGDKIYITSANVGKSYIQVKDASLLSGTAVTGHKNLLLVTVASGTATFEGKNLNSGGLWTLTPKIENGANVTDSLGNVIGNSRQWYLTHVLKAINNDTKVLLEGSDNSYALWRNTNDTLRKRLGDLHYRTNEIDGDGIWARYTGGKFGGSGFDSSYNMYQLGYDKADNAKSTYGFALESGTGHADYSFGSGKDKLFSGSFYGTWTGDDGSYTDVVAKIGQFDTDIKSYGDYPDKASYKNRAYSVSIEYGKTIELSEKSGTFVEPQLQFIAGRLGSSEYTTDRGNNVYVGGLNSYIGRVGFVAGQKTKEGNDVYFKASALHEFGGSRDIHMTAANGETLSMSKDYSDTWFEVGIGTNIKLSKVSYFYGDIERSFGGEIEKKWQVNAGVRFEF